MDLFTRFLWCRMAFEDSVNTRDADPKLVGDLLPGQALGIQC